MKFLKVFYIFLFIGHLNAQVDSSRMFIFGHSLIDHRPPMISTPSDETTVPHWVSIIADYAGKSYAAGGKYGFLPQHANTLPPFSQWGYDTVQGVWDSDIEPFSEANISDILITAGNFIQLYPPTMNYYGADSIYTPISATRTVFDWVDNEQTTPTRYYIYENWPEMSSFLANDIPPSPAEWDAYHQYTLSTFHDWWLTYQDSLISQRPNLNPRMIPVGPILSKLLTSELLYGIPFSELYEDADPHGRPTIYFLASVVTYMSIYAEAAPEDMPIDPIVHQLVHDNYSQIISFIWDELINFSQPNGESRVFYSGNSPVHIKALQNDLTVYPNPTQGILIIDGETNQYHIDILDATGSVYQNIQGNGKIEVNISNLPSGLYFLRIEHSVNGSISLEKILKQ